MSANIEEQFISRKRLGRRPPKMAEALHFSRFWTGIIPEHPIAVDYLNIVADWDILGNDTYGDCGPVSVANLVALVTKTLTGVENYPTLDQVLDLYRRSGNPNFPVDDNGVDMQTMLEELHNNGIGPVGGRTRCVAFAKVSLNNLDEVRAAIAIFGGLLLGVDLDIAQQSQTDTTKVWDFVPGSPEWGGHAVLAASYTSAVVRLPDIGVESWAQIIGLTDSFFLNQAEEAWVVILPQHLGTTQFMSGVNLNALAADYRILTGDPLPLPTPPAPAPTPSPVPPSPQPPADLVAEVIHLWQKLDSWLKRHGYIS